MENANGNSPVAPAPPSAPAPPQTVYTSYNQQNPLGAARPSLPVDFIIVIGLLLLSAVYTFFAGTTSSLNAGNGFLNFILSLANIVLLTLVLLKNPTARKILVGLTVAGIIFYAFGIISMMRIQRQLTKYQYQYDQAVAKLEEERGLTAANSPQIRQLNQRMEEMKAQNSKLVGPFYIASGISLSLQVLLLVYLLSPRIKKVFTPVTG